GIPEVKEKFGVERPEQVIDYLGMMGDASDNIPGLPGVGEKTAKKFIKEFGSIEELLANTHKLKGKMKERLEEFGEQGILSKKLATIKCDCNVQFNAKDYELSMPDAEKVQEIFEELEFRRLKDQFLKLFSGEETSAPTQVSSTATARAQMPTAGAGQFSLFGEDTQKLESFSGRKTLQDSAHVYQSLAPGLATNLFLQNLLKQKSVCFDTETTSLNPLEAKLVGIAFSWEEGKGFYLPFPEDDNEARTLAEKLRPFFEAEGIEKIGQNLKYDIKVLAKYNIEIKGNLFDTMIAHYLINPDMRHSLDVLAETYLNYSPQTIDELFGGKKGKNQSK